MRQTRTICEHQSSTARFERRATASTWRTLTATAIAHAVLASSALAGTLHVPKEYTTIQAAIDASADGDEIAIAAGTYTGPGNKDLTCAGRAITIRGSSMETCVIDLQGSGTAFILDAGEGPDTRIEQLTVRDSTTGGLGLRCIGASPTIVDCIFQDFHAPSDGPAVHVEGGQPRFERCRFLSNRSTATYGGAVYQSGGAVVFEDCTFQENTAMGASGSARGGAIHTRAGSLTITGGAFLSNWAAGQDDFEGFGSGDGGALHAMNTTLTVRDTIFEGNEAYGYGGNAAGGAMKLETCTGAIDRCNLTNNTASASAFFSGVSSHGGAVWLDDSDLDWRDCELSGNAAIPDGFDNQAGDGGGGAVDVRGTSTCTFARCLFSENRCSDGNGGAIEVGSQAQVTLASCTAARNTTEGLDTGGGGLAVNGSAQLSNCLITGNLAVQTEDASTDVYWGSGQGLLVRGTAELDNCTVADNGHGYPDFLIEAPDAVHTTFETVARNSIIRVEAPGLDALTGTGDIDIAFCNVSGGAPGKANIDVDPGFMSTGSDGYRLAEGSLCIDAGSNAALPADTLDLNDDGDVFEPLPVDLDGAPRVVGAAVDIGAYERQATCMADLDGTGSIGFGDLTEVLNAWGPCNAICGCITSATTWQNRSIGRFEGNLTVEFDHRPLIDQTDALLTLGLSPLSGPTFDDYAILIRLSPAGWYDVRNGSTYTRDAQVFYTAGETYRIRIEADVPANTYSVWVTPEGGSETQIAANYAFRTTQQGITALDTLGIWGFEPASHKVCDVEYGAPGATGSCPCLPDLDGNGSVGFSDLTILIAQWGACP